MKKKSNINNLEIITLSKFCDNRGSFTKIFDNNIVYKNESIKQINSSFNSSKGTLRGMHFQKPPFSERKIIYCTRGQVFDVAVDLRSTSSTFLNVFEIILDENDNIAVDIPRGCCHGFLTLKDKSELIYFHFDEYNHNEEFPIKYDDPLFKINWPIEVSIISKKDELNFNLDNNFKGF